MKIILVTLFISIACSAQVKIYTDQLLADSLTLNSGTDWINEFSKDGTLVGNSDKAIPTEKAIKTYVDGKVTVDVSALTTSIDSVGDTTAVHNTRIKANLTLINAKQDSIDSHTDTLQAHIVKINSNTNNISSHADSINFLGDTSRAHNVRLIALEAAGGGSGTGTIDTLGGQDQYHVAYFNDSATIGGSSELRFNPGDYFSVEINSGAGLDVLPTYSRIYGTGTAMIRVWSDTVEVTEKTVFDDSVYIGYILNADDPWLTINEFGAIDTGFTEDAGFALRMKLPILAKHLKQTDGEIYWYVKDSVGNVYKVLGMEGLGPMSSKQALQAANEIAFRYIFRLQIIVFILFVFVTGMGIFIYKKTR